MIYIMTALIKMLTVPADMISDTSPSDIDYGAEVNYGTNNWSISIKNAFCIDAWMQFITKRYEDNKC